MLVVDIVELQNSCDLLHHLGGIPTRGSFHAPGKPQTSRFLLVRVRSTRPKVGIGTFELVGDTREDIRGSVSVVAGLVLRGARSGVVWGPAFLSSRVAVECTSVGRLS